MAMTTGNSIRVMAARCEVSSRRSSSIPSCKRIEQSKNAGTWPTCADWSGRTAGGYSSPGSGTSDSRVGGRRSRWLEVATAATGEPTATKSFDVAFARTWPRGLAILRLREKVAEFTGRSPEWARSRETPFRGAGYNRNRVCSRPRNSPRAANCRRSGNSRGPPAAGAWRQSVADLERISNGDRKIVAVIPASRPSSSARAWIASLAGEIVAVVPCVNAPRRIASTNRSLRHDGADVEPTSSKRRHVQRNRFAAKQRDAALQFRGRPVACDRQRIGRNRIGVKEWEDVAQNICRIGERG